MEQGFDFLPRHPSAGSASGPPRLVSFVVPVRDEEPTLAQLYWAIAEAMRRLETRFEVLFVDDGSEDASWQEIQELVVLSEGRVRGLRMRRNVGKARALETGFRAAAGEVVVMLDGDLQDDPREVPRFLEKLAEGWDLVCGWKRVRHDPWHKVLPSRVFNALVGLLSGVHLHDHNCGFKAMRREVALDLHLYGEMHRMIPALAAMAGYRSTELVVQHQARSHGRSKYGLTRFWRGLADLATVWYLQRYRERPAHLLLALPLALLVLAGAVLALGALGEGVPAGLALAAPALVSGAICCLALAALAAQLVHDALSRPWVAPLREDTAEAPGATDELAERRNAS